MKTILSTNKKEILVDDKDYAWVKNFNWHVSSCDGVTMNKVDFNSDMPTYSLPRILMGLDFGDSRVVDHENHNRCDNRRCNLRVCTQSQNMANQRKRVGASSKYKGVHWCKKDKRWRAQIRVNYKTLYLGQFEKELDAAAAYDVAALTHFGEFALPNFEMAMMGELS